MSKPIALGLAVALAALPACETSATAPEDLLEGGVLATFRVSEEEFHVWVTNEVTIQQILDLRDGRSTANIPNGTLHEGPGRADHNAPWTCTWTPSISRWPTPPSKSVMVGRLSWTRCLMTT